MGFLYHFFKNTSRIALPFFFGKVDVRGKENIPLNRPYIIAPNHQNSFLDAVILGAYSKKSITFLARSDVFVRPFDRILAALNMMPVYRRRDGFEKLKLNEITFNKCDEVLAEGNPVLIFPESNTAHEYYLRPITKGIARMAFQSQSKLEEDLFILPVGLNYGHHLYPFHRFILNYGTPIRVRDYVEIHQQNAAKGLISIKNDITAGMKSTLLLPDKTDDLAQKTNILHRQYEALSFEGLKALLKSPDKLQKEHYYSVLKPISALLMLPSLLPFLLMYFYLSTLKDPQFILSFKFVFTFLVFPLYWILLALIVTFLCSIQWAGLAVAISIASIFLRQWLRKRIR